MNFLAQWIAAFQIFLNSLMAGNLPPIKDPNYLELNMKFFSVAEDCDPSDLREYNDPKITQDCSSLVQFQYPVFTSETASKGVSIINDQINQWMVHIPDMLSDEPSIKWSSDLTVLGYQFLKECKRSDPEDYDLGHSCNLERKISVVFNHPRVLSLEARYVEGVPPTNPWYGSICFNMNPQTGKKYELKDLLKPGFEEKLKKSDKKFFKYGNEILTSNVFGQLVSKNFLISPTHLVFIYNMYDLGWGRGAIFRIGVPYSELKDVIPQDGLLDELMKENSAHAQK